MRELFSVSDIVILANDVFSLKFWWWDCVICLFRVLSRCLLFLLAFFLRVACAGWWNCEWLVSDWGIVLRRQNRQSDAWFWCGPWCLGCIFRRDCCCVWARAFWAWLIRQNEVWRRDRRACWKSSCNSWTCRLRKQWVFFSLLVYVSRRDNVAIFVCSMLFLFVWERLHMLVSFFLRRISAQAHILFYCR